MVKCPNCGKKSNKFKKSWAYGVFRVDSYSCDCGLQFNEYTKIHVILSENGKTKPKIEKHDFILKLENGKWVKAKKR